jgi:dienelactone hydrolase
VVSVYTFGPISEACVLYAQRLYMRKSAVLGVTGSSFTGQVTMTIPTDRDVEALLSPYKRRST